jgi:MIZ/SP-RING zinc finger
VPHSMVSIGAGDWSVTEMSWPSSCFVGINKVGIELRRKLHHGKDLPVDLTPHVREGKNSITMATLHGREEPTPKRYAMAVEIVTVGDQARVDSAPTILTASESLKSITQGVTKSPPTSGGGDDEVQVVDSRISIDLIDPFMATIFDTPARGTSCTHRECFDLQTFFQTRKSKTQGGPTSPDEWKCPICKKDARPQSLIVDCFLKTVRDSLVNKGGAADARAILIGGETAQASRDSSSATLADSPAFKGTVMGNRAGAASVVIEIEAD